MMAKQLDYAVVRVHADSYRLDRITPPRSGAAAFITIVRDRLGNPTGWRLKPLVVMHGARSRFWPSVAEALAANKLMKPGEAKAAIKAADPGHAAPARGAP